MTGVSWRKGPRLAFVRRVAKGVWQQVADFRLVTLPQGLNLHVHLVQRLGIWEKPSRLLRLREIIYLVAAGVVQFVGLHDGNKALLRRKRHDAVQDFQPKGREAKARLLISQIPAKTTARSAADSRMLYKRRPGTNARLFFCNSLVFVRSHACKVGSSQKKFLNPRALFSRRFVNHYGRVHYSLRNEGSCHV